MNISFFFFSRGICVYFSCDRRCCGDHSRYFSHLGVFLISVKPSTTETTETKTTVHRNLKNTVFPIVFGITYSRVWDLSSPPAFFEISQNSNPKYECIIHLSGGNKVVSISDRSSPWSRSNATWSREGLAGSPKYRFCRGQRGSEPIVGNIILCSRLNLATAVRKTETNISSKAARVHTNGRQEPYFPNPTPKRLPGRERRCVVVHHPPTRTRKVSFP